MADEDKPHAAIGDQTVEDSQHLDLHGHIQRRCRLIRDQQIGLGDQHHRDHRALAHAAGKFMRIGLEHAGRITDLHRLQHRHGTIFRLGPARCAPCRLDQLAANRHHRVQRKLRVLHDHRHSDTAQTAPFGGRCAAQINAVEVQRFGGCNARRWGQAQNCAPGLGFAGTGFADNAQPFTRQRKRHAAHHFGWALPGGEGDAQIVHRQQVCHAKAPPAGVFWRKGNPQRIIFAPLDQAHRAGHRRAG